MVREQIGKVRDQPLPAATQVFVSGSHPRAPAWWYVTAYLDGAMVRGYVQDFRVTTDLPEPTAKLHHITSGDTAERLATEAHGSAVRDGHDLRYYENVLLYVNQQRGRAGITGSFQDPGVQRRLDLARRGRARAASLHASERQESRCESVVAPGQWLFSLAGRSGRISRCRWRGRVAQRSAVQRAHTHHVRGNVSEPSVEPVAHPDDALARIVESLVISYALDDAGATFLLIADFPERAPGAQRSFVALRFSGVRDFHRTPGTLAELQPFLREYALVNSPRPVMIQDVEHTADRIALFLGPNFGDVTFRYAEVRGWIRHAHAENRAGQWFYRDADTGEPLELARPFAGVLESC
ncbi:MAG TPA: hypothetical protein VFP84_12830 [Kofleriaceae bacterium]|nr:hypothetical protein [Kofleriaceae bacterium]